MLAPLATPTEAAEFGFALDAPQLRQASARIRGALGQQVTAGESTVKAGGPVFRLPERPVREVVSVVDTAGAPVPFEAVGSLVTLDNWAPGQTVTVTYRHGYVDLPDELVELVCQVAKRISNTDPQIEAGKQQVSMGPFAATMGWDAWKSQAGLAAGEIATLLRYWPELPQVVSVGAP